MDISIRLAALAATVAIIAFSTAHAQTASSSVPRTISYQGLLIDDSPGGVSDGIHRFVFSLYENADGGPEVYTETQQVTVRGGIFDAIIGAATPGGIPAAVSFERAYFLGIRVDDGQELRPRTALTSAPYSMRAAVADSVGGGLVRSITNTDGSIEVTDPAGPNPNIGVKFRGIISQHLADGAVTAAKIADGAVAAAKINTENAPAGTTLMSDGTTTPVWGYPAAPDLVLPYAGTRADTATLFAITNSGRGRAALFRADSTNSYTGVLEATTSGSGLVARFTSTNTTAFANSAVQISSAGSSVALQVYGGGGNGWFLPGYPGGVYASSGSGTALQGSTQSGVGTYGGASTGTGVYAQARGTGNGLIAVSENGGTSTTTTGNIALFKNTVNAGNVARINNLGKGFFNGGTQTGGADVAEAFDVEGPTSDYEPGDVLVISTTRDRTVVRSSTPYSTAVVGVYATKPGVLLSDLNIDDDQSHRVPMGMLGVIPTKVCSENGPIRRGDLLATSSLRGHAMKASPITINGVQFHPGGVIIGKALEDFDEEGTGLIEVMVSVK